MFTFRFERLMAADDKSAAADGDAAAAQPTAEEAAAAKAAAAEGNQGDEAAAAAQPTAEEAAAAKTDKTAEELAAEAADAEVDLVEEVPEWVKKEVGRKHAKLKQAEEMLAVTRAELENARKVIAAGDARPVVGADGKPVAAPVPQPQRNQYGSQQDFDAAVATAATAQNAQAEYNRSCETANAAGIKAYGKNWDTAVKNLETLGGFDVETMNGVLSTDDPARVLFELGRNPEEYARITSLPPARRLAEMIKIAISPKPQPRVSTAPAPVSTVGNRAAGSTSKTVMDIPDDPKHDDEWFAKRRAERTAKWKRENNIPA